MEKKIYKAKIRVIRASKSNFVLKKAAEHAFVEKRDYIRP